MNEQELQKLLSDDTMRADVLAEIEKMDANKKKKDAIEKAGLKYWKGGNGRFRAKVYINGERKSLDKTHEQDIIDALYLIATGESEKPKTFVGVYNEWRSARVERTKSHTLQPGTIYTDDIQFRRFYEGTDFIKKQIKLIQKKDIDEFVIKSIEKAKNDGSLTNYALYCNITGILNGVFRMAYENAWIDDNPTLWIDSSIKASLSHKRYAKEESERYLTDEECDRIEEELDRRHQENPDDVRVMAYQLYMAIGCRMGEAVAIRWSDVSGYDTDGEADILIRDTAHYDYQICDDGKYHRRGELLKGDTKTMTDRKVPMTDWIKRILRNTKSAQVRMGVISEFVFADRKSKITEPAMSNFVGKLNRGIGIKGKGITTCRRTVASRMGRKTSCLADVSSILGHTERCDLEHYQYASSGRQEKKRLLEG